MDGIHIRVAGQVEDQHGVVVRSTPGPVSTSSLPLQVKELIREPLPQEAGISPQNRCERDAAETQESPLREPKKAGKQNHEATETDNLGFKSTDRRTGFTCAVSQHEIERRTRKQATSQQFRQAPSSDGNQQILLVTLKRAPLAIYHDHRSLAFSF